MLFRRKRKFGAKRGHASGEMELQITSMADIFTILLVFLLKSYATSAVAVNPSGGMKLPQAQGSDIMTDALKLEISENGVVVEGQPATGLKGFAFDSSDIDKNGSSRTLASAIETHRKRQLLIASANTEVKVDPKVIVIADERVPYSTIKSVLASAAIHGYTDFKLAVVKPE